MSQTRNTFEGCGVDRGGIDHGLGCHSVICGATRRGGDYVSRALFEARAASSTARLLINDYGFDYDNPVEEGRRRSFLRLIERLKAKGAPLDGVGLQAHLDLSKGPLRVEIMRPFLADLAGLGLSIAITELDVKEADTRLPIAKRDRRVADEVRRYLDIVLDEPAVRGITTWGLSDRHSWLNEETASGAALNRGLPYDADLAPQRCGSYPVQIDGLLPIRAHSTA